MHFLERPGDRDHAQGHGNILKLIRKFAELTGGFGEGIQLEPLQVRRGGDHGLGNDDLPHNSGQLIQLAQIDADETFAVVSAGIGRGLRRGGGRSGLSIGGGFLLRGLRGRGLLLGGERLRGRGRNGAGLRAVKGLIGPDRARARDCMDGIFTVLCIPEVHHEAGVDDLARGAGICGDVGGRKVKIPLPADITDRIDQHKGTGIFHAAALIKKDLKRIGEIRIFCRLILGDRPRLPWGRGLGSTGVLNLLDQGINFLQQAVDIFSKGLPIFDMIDLLTEEVDGLEKQLEQLRAVGLWDDVHGLVPNDGKQVLSAVGDRHDGAILHHGRGAFDGVHNTEDSIDILLREGVLFL